jgi:hypothetical protein
MASRAHSETRVKESNTKRRYRVARDFAFYDERGSHIWRSWRSGNEVTDPKDIALLTARDVPLEIIEPLEEDSK